MRLNKLYSNKGGTWVLLILLVLVNWLASLWHSRIDLTNEKRFTLSQPTKQLLKNVPGPVTIDVFLKGNYPSGFRKLSATTEEVLREFKEIAGNNLRFNFISPEESVPGTETMYGDSLSALQLYPINLTSQVKQGQQQQFVYPFALVHYQEKTIPVSLYQGKTPLINFQELNSAEAMLEYNLANAIYKASAAEKQVIAYSMGNGEPVDFRTYDLVENVLKPDYELFTYNLNSPGPIPPNFSLLMIVKPSLGFTDMAKFKLDQYIMNGGKLILFLDRLNAEMDSLQILNEVTAYDRDLKLNDLLFRYGARVNADLVMDLQCDFLPFDVNGNGQFELLPWNYFPVLESKSNHPINKNLGFVSAKFINSIDTIEVEGIRKTILLSSSQNARKIATPAIISSRENVNAPEDEKFRVAQIPVAVLLQGRFRSFYANRLSAQFSDTLSRYGQQFAAESLKENSMIIVADGDMALNSVVKGEPIPMGMNPYTYGSQREFPFANKNFVQNSLDFLLDPSGISEAKSKDYILRVLDNKRAREEQTYWQVINIAVPILLVIFAGFVFQWRRRKKYAL